MKQEEINKRFDEHFKSIIFYDKDEAIMAYPSSVQIKSFIHSEISLAVAEREKEIVKELERYRQAYHYDTHTEGIYTEIINLITKQK